MSPSKILRPWLFWSGINHAAPAHSKWNLFKIHIACLLTISKKNRDGIDELEMWDADFLKLFRLFHHKKWNSRKRKMAKSVWIIHPLNFIAYGAGGGGGAEARVTKLLIITAS